MNDLQLQIKEENQEWSYENIEELFHLPFADLILHAQLIHRTYHNPNQVQVSCLLSIKTGACPENCAYCPQSAHFDTGVQAEKFWKVEDIVEKAQQAKKNGATRFCMGGSWRSVPEREMPKLVEMVEKVKALGLETCLTAGMLTQKQADTFKEAGLDIYNHNLDTSPEYYKKIITTRSYQERMDTLQRVANAGIEVCCGGIMGLGETLKDRIEFLLELKKLTPSPSSIPINQLIAVEGTPLEEQAPIDTIEFIKMIAVTRILFQKSMVRLSAGRNEMSEETQTLCFFAGANSIHTGDKLLTTSLKGFDTDAQLFKRLGITPYIPKNVEMSAV